MALLWFKSNLAAERDDGVSLSQLGYLGVNINCTVLKAYLLNGNPVIRVQLKYPGLSRHVTELGIYASV